MRLDDQRESDNIDDRRGAGGGGGFGLSGGSLSIGGLVLALVVSYFTGINPVTLLGLMDGGSSAPPRPPQTHHVPANDPTTRFVARVLGSTEDVWTTEFNKLGREYRKPVLTLFTGSTSTACGRGQAAMGPFYCPPDQRVYIDLDFFHELETRFHAGGEFAQAYVIAHEVGHHVQNLLGISAKVEEARRRVSETRGNALSVRLELQADCFAGVWGHYADVMKHQLTAGEMEQAIRAAEAIGDDQLQRQARGVVIPESFTHGSSEQRVRWFSRGFKEGDIRQCDTFKASSL